MRTWLEYKSTSQISGDRVYVDRIEIKSPLHEFPLFELMEGPSETWLVNGFIIRTYLCDDWHCGGHHYLYPFIKPGEIWIESNTYPEERPFIHMEWSISRFLMKEMNLPFLEAGLIGRIYGSSHMEEQIKNGSLIPQSLYPKKSNLILRYGPPTFTGEKGSNPEADQIHQVIESLQGKQSRLEGNGWPQIISKLQKAEADLRMTGL